MLLNISENANNAAADADAVFDAAFTALSVIENTAMAPSFKHSVIETINSKYVREDETERDKANVLERIMGNYLEGGSISTVPEMVEFFNTELNVINDTPDYQPSQYEIDIITEVFTEWYAAVQNNGIM